MLDDPRATIFMGLAGSLASAGQARLIAWFIENGLLDVLVTTGANISEDLINALGYQYYQCPTGIDDSTLRDAGYNRLYDVCIAEKDYVSMTEVIAEFLATLSQKVTYSSRTLLQKFGNWLEERNINCILSSAARCSVPVFCPALLDSAYGDAVLISRNRGKHFLIDAVQDHVEFISLDVDETGVIYVGGGVPKDLIQTFAVSIDFLFGTTEASQRRSTIQRNSLKRTYSPHKYSLQITTDSPQWGEVRRSGER
jgi:deoxyhypusine synthase